MQAYIITIQDNTRSIESANRCIESAKRYNIDIQKFEAVIPGDYMHDIIEVKKLDVSSFSNKYSRVDNAIACFCSHYMLWEKCRDSKENMLILEHDAYFVNEIPNNLNFHYLMNVGKPSYGKFKIPTYLGKNKLTSKEYLPGAHAYIITPEFASILIEKAKVGAFEADIFINNNNFPGMLEEFYPWPVEARDSFTTIQKTRGCLAKHNYKEGEYEII